MAQKILSIYITNDLTSVCEVSKSGKGVSLHRIFQMETPKGSVDDGSIIEPDLLAQKLRDMMEANKGLKKDKLIFTVSSKKIANKELMLPFMKNTNKIREIIVSNAADYFPMSNINDYTYDFSILETVQQENGKQYRVSAIAVQKELLESYHVLAKAMKMPIESIDYQGNSVLQILQMQMQKEMCLVLHIEKELTNVIIMQGNVQSFRRSIPFGMDSVAQALAEVKNIPEEDALELLRNPKRMVEEVKRHEYVEAISDTAAAVGRVVDFYTSRNPGLTIEAAKLYGEEGVVEGLSNILEKEMGVTTSFPRKLEGVQIKGNDIPAEMDITKYLPNLGAVLRPIGLTKPGERNKSDNPWTVYWILLGGAAIISGTMVGMAYYNYYDILGRKEMVEAEIAQIKDVQELYDAYLLTHESYENIKEFYAATQNDTEMLYPFFLDLEKVTPESVGFTNISVQDGEISIGAVSAGKEPIAMFVMELKKIPYVTYIWVENKSDVYDETGQALSTFNIKVNLRTQRMTEEKQTEGERTEEEAGQITEESEQTSDDGGQITEQTEQTTDNAGWTETEEEENGTVVVDSAEVQGEDTGE